MKINRGYKYRLRPTRKQKILINKYCGSCRFIYNKYLQETINNYKETNKRTSCYDQMKTLPILKKKEDTLWLQEVPSQSLQAVLKNLDRSFKNFFKGISSFPVFKKKNKTIDSVNFPQGDKISIIDINSKNSYIKLPKLKLVKFRKHRDFEGSIKNATISRDGLNYYISFCVEENIEVTPRHLLENTIGLDKGVTHTITTSNSEFFDLPVSKIKTIENTIKKYQIKLSKQIKFTVRWLHFKRIINRLHKKITRIRIDFLHKLSYNLTKNHSLVVVEDLKLSNMTRSSKGTIESPGSNVAQKSGLNRSILRQGLGILQNFLDYKSLWYSSEVVKVNPKYTSQTCYSCGYRDKDNRKSQSIFHCLKCNYEDNADINAAKNILRLGIESLGIESLEAPTKTAKAV